MKLVLSTILAFAALPACSSAPPPHAPLVVRVQTWGEGINARPRTEMVADSFETGAARVLRATADPTSAEPKNAASYRLSEAATARILHLVAQLEQAPEPIEWEPCVISRDADGDRAIVISDGRQAEIEISTEDGRTRYARNEPFYDKVSRIVSLVSGDPEAPPDMVCLPKR